MQSCVEHAMVKRRTLLGGIAAGVAVSTVSVDLAFAASASYAGDTLVVVSLHGGFDGLSAIVPIGDPDYYRARPTIAVPKSRVIAGDGTFGLHPALAPLLPAWQNGRLAAVHAVGQPNPTRSHFAAMETMEHAAPGTSVRTGWLDRMLGVTSASGGASPLAGVSMGSAMPDRLLAGPSADVSMRTIDSLTLAGDGKRPIAAALRTMYADAPPHLAAPALAAGRALAAMAAPRAVPAGTGYPGTDLGAALRDVARLIKANAGLVTATVDCGDWDMHEALGPAVAGQRMHDNLADLATALAAFSADLGSAVMNRVTVLTISEFGRRVAENGSHGADHGHGNAMLLLGGGVKGGKVYTRWPTVAASALVDGDLAATTDYRSVIGELLQKRCGLGDLSSVFPGAKPSTFGLALAR
jgi:uncharacterized protein (DUF1501 family)